MPTKSSFFYITSGGPGLAADDKNKGRNDRSDSGTPNSNRQGTEFY
jgi:hypothetical protein